MRLKLRHLEVFEALFEAGSVSQAADRLNLSQPAVSVALGKLETDLGFRLFHRERGFFAPTNEALLLRDDMQRGMAAITRLKARAEQVRDGVSGQISIATNGVLAMNFLPRLIAEFHRDHPGARIDLHIDTSRRIASMVSNRQIDIGFIDLPVPVAGLKAEVFRLDCVCIFREDDPLAARDEVTPADLESRKVIAITGDHIVDQQLQRAMVDAGLGLDQPVAACYFAIARNLVAAGDGVALVDPINGKAALNDGVVWRPFRPTIVHELPMLTHRSHPLSITGARFCDRIRTALNRYGTSA